TVRRRRAGAPSAWCGSSWPGSGCTRKRAARDATARARPDSRPAACGRRRRARDRTGHKTATHANYPSRMTSAAHPFVVADARRRLRSAKDAAARVVVTAGGVAVIGAITLIFVYLLSVVLPLFSPASMRAGQAFPLPGPAGETLHLAVEERAAVAARYTASAVIFFDTADGTVIERRELPGGATATAAGISDLAGGGVVLGLDDGRILPVTAEYRVRYGDGGRRIEPDLAYPLGEDPVVVDPRGRAVSAVAGRFDRNGARFVSVLEDGGVVLTHVELRTSFLTGETEIAGTGSRELAVRIGSDELPVHVLLDPTQQWICLAAESGEAAVLRRRGNDYVV